MSEVLKRLDADIMVSMKDKTPRKTTLLKNIKTELLAYKNKFPTDKLISETEYYTVLESLIKKRRDTARIYADTKEYKYNDPKITQLAKDEIDEANWAIEYLPPDLAEIANMVEFDDDTLNEAIKEIILDNQFSGMKDMGKAMIVFKDKLKGRADAARIGAMAKKLLS